MPFTIGAGTTDVIVPPSTTVGARPSGFWIMGWFYPTTLTAGRKLYSWGSLWAIQIDSTSTANLRFIADNNTTDDTKRTTDAAMSTNNWYFVAALNNCSSAATTQWSVWFGDGLNPPTKRTLTNVATASGNLLTGTGPRIGNGQAGATVAFQGDMGWWAFKNLNASSTYPLDALDGATIAAEEDLFEKSYVLPAWRGDFRWLWDQQQMGATTLAKNGGFLVCPMDNARRVYSATGVSQLTVTGATLSNNREPRPLPDWAQMGLQDYGCRSPLWTPGRRLVRR